MTLKVPWSVDRLQPIVGHREVGEPAPVVAELDRDTRQHLLLDRHAVLPVPRARRPAVQELGVERGGEPVPAEIHVADLRAQIAAGSQVVLRHRVQQIAVGREIAVASVHVRVAVVVSRPDGFCGGVGQTAVGVLHVLAGVDLDRRSPGPEHVPRHSPARHQVLVAGDAVGPWIGDGGRQESLRADRLLGKIASGIVEPKRALDRHAAERPLFLRVERVEPHAGFLLEGVDVLGQLVRHAVVDAEVQELRVRIGEAVGDLMFGLIAHLQALPAGHVGGGAAPTQHPLKAVPEESGAVGQVRDIAVARAGHRALLGHPHETGQRAAGLLGAAPLTEVGAEARFEQQPVADGRGPCRLLHPLAVAGQERADLGRRRRGARRVGGLGRAADDLALPRLAASFLGAQIPGALAGDLVVPEDVELVSRRRLHRHTQRRVAPAASLNRGPARVRDIGPLRRIAHVLRSRTCRGRFDDCLRRETERRTRSGPS